VARILASVEAERAGVAVHADAAGATGTDRGVAANAPATGPEPGPAEPAALEPIEPEPEPAAPAAHRAARRWRTTPWLPRFALGITAAAAVVALFIGARVAADRGLPAGLTSSRSTTSGAAAGTAETSAGTAVPEAATPSDALGATGSAKSSSAAGSAQSHAATPEPEPMTAPVPAVVTPPLGPSAPTGYVPPVNALVGQPVFLTFGAGDPHRPVWRFSGWLRNTPSNILVRVGTVNARLGAGGRPVTRTVYERIGDSTQKFVSWSDDDYQVYRPVTMRLQAEPAAYALVSASAVPDWGFWPAWPQSVAPYPRSGTVPGAAIPNADGATVYRAGSARSAGGFAVSPSGKADPVARIPKWTWYSAPTP
jgi:hypothetical protein